MPAGKVTFCSGIAFNLSLKVLDVIINFSFFIFETFFSVI